MTLITATGGQTVRWKIEGEDADNPATFSTYADFIARVRTTANVSWINSAASYPPDYYTSPDISSIIQEIVNRGGWASGNHIAIFMW
jgi:hypothetical protein